MIKRNITLSSIISALLILKKKIYVHSFNSSSFHSIRIDVVPFRQLLSKNCYFLKQCLKRMLLTIDLYLRLLQKLCYLTLYLDLLLGLVLNEQTYVHKGYPVRKQIRNVVNVTIFIRRTNNILMKIHNL